MVSRLSPILRGLSYRPFRTASRSQLSLARIFAVCFLFAAAWVPLVAAEDPDCYSPQIVSIDTPDSATAPTDVTLRATVNGCTDCTYRWTISKYDCLSENAVLTGPEPVYHVQAPSRYRISLNILKNALNCGAYSLEHNAEKDLFADGNPSGIGGHCCAASHGGISITQIRDTSEAGGIHRPFWTAEISPVTCWDCTYGWLIMKSSDGTENGLGGQVPPDANDVESIHAQSMSHLFTESGLYQVNLVMSNPPGCYANGMVTDFQNAQPVYHRVTGSAVTTSVTTAAGVTPDTVTVVPVITTPVPAPVTTVVSSVTTRQVTPVITAAITEPVTPQGTQRQATQMIVTTTRSDTGTGGQTTGVTPVSTTAVPGGSGSGTNAAGGSLLTNTTVLLGIIAVLALIICAGVLYLVFRKK